MSDISRWLGITKSTTTGLVKRLIDAEFVERRRSQKDRRSFIIDLTESGHSLIERVISRRVDYLQSVMTEISPEQVVFFEKTIALLLEVMDRKEEKQ